MLRSKDQSCEIFRQRPQPFQVVIKIEPDLNGSGYCFSVKLNLYHCMAVSLSARFVKQCRDSNVNLFD